MALPSWSDENKIFLNKLFKEFKRLLSQKCPKTLSTKHKFQNWRSYSHSTAIILAEIPHKNERRIKHRNNYIPPLQFTRLPDCHCPWCQVNTALLWRERKSHPTCLCLSNIIIMFMLNIFGHKIMDNCLMLVSNSHPHSAAKKVSVAMKKQQINTYIIIIFPF